MTGTAVSRTEEGNALNRVHRRKSLLSELLECGCCGGGYTIVGKDRYGCGTLQAKGTCSNQRTIMRQHIETRVLSGLKERLLAPELVAEAVRVFADEMAASRKEAAQRWAGQPREMAEVRRSLGGILKAIESSAWSDTLRDRLTELEVRKAALTAELAQGDDAPTVVLHPAAAEAYRYHMQELEAALNDPALLDKAAEVLRNLMAKIMLPPDVSAEDGLQAELHGAAAEILSLGHGRSPALRAGFGCVLTGQLSGVAGTGFEPVTFRL